MVSVMQQHPETELLLQCQDRVHYSRLIPFMNEHDISLTQLRLQVRFECAVILEKEYPEVRESFAEIVNGLNRLVLLAFYKVGERPRAELFVTPHFVSHASEI